ncbi:MAG: hypothetical protein LBU62_09705 [Bacteroidales bacterium]|jgi:hypothetical protein|nr:hypothetical protein [Bacteroidales bacterium]
MKRVSRVFTCIWAAAGLMCLGAVAAGATWHLVTAGIAAAMFLLGVDEWNREIDN